MNQYTFETHIPWNGKFAKNGKAIKVIGETYEKAYRQAKSLLPKDFSISHLSKVEPVASYEAPKPVSIPPDLRHKLALSSLRAKINGDFYDLLRTDTIQCFEDFGFRKQPISEVLGLLEIGLANWMISDKNQYRKLVNSKRKKRGLSTFSPFEWYKFQNATK